ncbi:MAG: hypothetical protein INR71_00695 [Terriglobus roseus]|nr:hypothetical protein [Terriglobus roseus]
MAPADLPRPDIGTFLAPAAKEVAAPTNGSHAAAAEDDSSPQQAQAQPNSSPSKPRAARKPSFGLDSDPWGSPEMHRGHNHGNAPAGGNLNGSSNGPLRTTSTFTTNASDGASGADASGAGANSGASDNSGWGNFNPAPNQQFRDSGIGGEGFGSPSGAGAGAGGGGPPGQSGINRSISASRVAGSGVEEIVTVATIPEKEGMFGFQHRNYEVASARRNSKVIRRYSDFVWLLDCLHKRYPFRQLPLLPPKRVAINGNHLAADVTFIEKRRKGLARFANALVRHPVLGQEQLVVMFLTVPTVNVLPVLPPRVRPKY